MRFCMVGVFISQAYCTLSILYGCMVVSLQVYSTLSMVYIFILQVEGYHQSTWSKNPTVCGPIGQIGRTQREDSSNCTQGSSSRDGYHVVCCTLYGLVCIVWYRCKVRLEQRGGVLPVVAGCPWDGESTCIYLLLTWAIQVIWAIHVIWALQVIRATQVIWPSRS